MSLCKYFLFLFVMCTTVVVAQTPKSTVNNWQKYGMDNTQLYLFRFSDKVNNENLIVKVVNEKFKTLSDKVRINGKLITRKNEFVYCAKPTNTLYGVKLPIILPDSTWVFVFNYSDQFLMLEGENKIKIILKNADKNNKWQLPEEFDMRSEVVLSFNQYLKGKADDIDAKFVPRLSLLEKVNPKTTVADTTLVYSLKKMPKGLPLICSGLNTNDHASQEFIIEKALLYKNEFFFYQPVASKKPADNHPDQCATKMTDISGNIGHASGCITGMGSGKCAGILASKATRKYRVTIIVEPN
jgi:hypothetical protein